jgi:hypothetical protein
MNKKVLGMVVVGFGLLGGCASGVAEQRGAVVMTPDTVKAIAAGPSVVHAFSLDRGGRVYVATAKTGTDADCDGASDAVGAMELAVDRRNVVKLARGQVACVATSSKRRYEVMWHARPAEPAMVLVAQTRR